MIKDLIFKKKIILYIDTSDRDVAKIRLQVDDKLFEAQSDRSEKKSQVVLRLVDEVRRKAGISISDIDTIKVKRGPGSYTGLRVGLSVANALAFALQIGVNGKRLGVIENALYEEKH